MLSVLVASLAMSKQDHRPLLDYLALPQKGLPTAKLTRNNGIDEIEFCSQMWQKQLWSHRILMKVPKGAEKSETAILFITGDGPRNGDMVDINLLSNATGMPIMMLFNIPNQPIWEMKEDDLIAHTFTKYLETGDATWPLLFPMTRAAVSSMDVIQRFTKQNGMNLKKFVVTGASKRGWTTWLTAASGDKRVAGIAPMVFDNLRFDAQMKHQIEMWGEYSEQIADYTRRGLQEKLQTKEGQKLMEMVDPYSYRDRIKIPTLIVNGSNDQYWATDATKLYWNDLKQPKNVLQVPNNGHGLSDRIRLTNSIGAFARSVNGSFKFPRLQSKTTVNEEEIAFNLDPSEGQMEAVSIWKAESDTKDFREQRFVEEKKAKTDILKTELKPGKWSAVFLEARYNIDGKPFTLSTPCEVAYGGKPQR
jgi:PhoPQ-activated pathogenicity-related protein